MLYFLMDTEVFQHVVIEDRRPLIPLGCPVQLASLMQQCWHSDPDKRPSFQQILQSHALDDDGLCFISIPIVGIVSALYPMMCLITEPWWRIVIVDTIISEANTHGRAFWKKCLKENNEILEV